MPGREVLKAVGMVEQSTAAGSAVNTGVPAADSGDSCQCVPVAQQLPTLQRNALRRIFDRHDFTAEEVARLGQHRIERAEGIGRKGLATIIEWLRCQGLELASRQPLSRDAGAVPGDVKRIEKAMRILKTHGYVVQGPEPLDDGVQDRGI